MKNRLWCKRALASDGNNITTFSHKCSPKVSGTMLTKKTLVDKGTPQLHTKVRVWKNTAVKCQAYVRRSIWSDSRQFPAQMVVAGVLETAAYPTLTSLVSTNRKPGHKWQNQQILPLELHECHAITLSPLRGWARGPRGQPDVLSVRQ